MKKGINLKLTTRRKNELSKKILVLSGIFFSTVTFIALLIISYKFYLGTSLNDTSQKKSELTASILRHNTKKDKLFDLHKRLANIGTIIEKRSRIVDKAIYVSGVVPSDSIVESLGAKENVVEYSISSENLNSLNELLEKKIYDLTFDKSKNVQIIEMSNFGFNIESGEYKLSFRVVFN